MTHPELTAPVNHDLKKEPEVDVENIIKFGNCLRFLDMSYDRLYNDFVNGVAPSVRYGVKRNSGYTAVSVTAFSREVGALSKLQRLSKGNRYFYDLFHGKSSHEGEGFIPFAYILSLEKIKKVPNVTRIQQNWGYGAPGQDYEGLEQYIKTPGQGNYWEGELRIYFADIFNSTCITLDTCEGILVREEDLNILKTWILKLREANIFFPKLPIFSPQGDRFLGFTSV